MCEDLVRAYPTLAGSRAEAVWWGEIVYGWNMMPMVGQRQEGLWHCVGFGGHGIVPTQLVGELLASAIAEDDNRWRVLADLFPLQPLASPRLNRLAGVMMYWLYTARDNAAIWSARVRARVQMLLRGGGDANGKQ